MASRGSDEAMLCRQTCNADEEDRGRRVPSDVLFSAKEETRYYKLKILAEPPLYGEVSKTYKKKLARWPTAYIRHEGPHIHVWHEGPHIHIRHEGHQ